MNEIQEWSKKVIKQTCEIVSQPEEIVTEVFKHQWRKAKKKARECNQIEFSGFGKFVTVPNRVKRKISAYEKLKAAWATSMVNSKDPEEIKNLEEKINILEPQIEDLRVRDRKHEAKH